jgi:trehalose 6-phosphate phosphatase
MEYLLGTKGLKRIRSICSAKTLFAFDFDGTLSKIYSHPHGARITDKTRQLLYRLNEMAFLAIISGRHTSDLKSHLGFTPGFLIGNHGASGLVWKKSLEATARQNCRTWKKQIMQFLEAMNMSGIELEDNLFTLALHYRHARNKHKAKTMMLEKALQLSPRPCIITGKSVVNIVPEGLPNKGDAFQKLMQMSKAGSAFYIGDDDTDESIFDLDLPCVLTGRVGYKKKSRAQYFLRRQSEINKLLQIILCTIGL